MSLCKLNKATRAIVNFKSAAFLLVCHTSQGNGSDELPKKATLSGLGTVQISPVSNVACKKRVSRYWYQQSSSTMVSISRYRDIARPDWEELRALTCTPSRFVAAGATTIKKP